MKKLIYCAAALAAGLFAASCQQENLEPVAQEGTVTYTVEVPAVVTKAIADGKNVDRLFYEVYKTNGADVTDLSGAVLLYKKDIQMVTSTEATSRANVTLNLVQNQYYTVLFWAQCGAEGQGVYDVSDLKAVTYKNASSIESNHENYAAFYAVDFISDSTPRAKKVYLKRPFAQLNIGTKYTIDYANDPYSITMLQSEVTVKKVPTMFNVATSAATKDVDFTFNMDDVLAESLDVNGEPYKYVAMNYMFAGENRTAEVTYTVNAEMKNQAGATIENVELNKTIVNVPLKENYRTNIVGNLLTSSTEYEVIVDADWAGNDLAPAPIYMAAANGGEFTLTEDIALTKPLVIQSSLTLNLNGKTLSYTGDDRLFKVKDGAVLTINGEDGAVTVHSNNLTSSTTAAYIGTAYAGSKIVVNGGTHTTNGCTLYHAYSGEIEINDGVFSADETGYNPVGKYGHKYTLNMQDNTGAIVVRGGSFKNYNPAHSESENPAANFVAEGYKSVMIDNTYVVLPVETAVASTKADLETVFSNGGTVILADDIQFEKITSIEPGKEVHLNLNGKTIKVDQNTTSNTLIYVKDGAKLIVDGNGIIDLGAVSTMAVFAPYGELVIENGTFIRDKVTVVTSKTTGLFMGAKTTASHVTINGGYFDAGYYDTNAADIEEILAGTKTFEETADDIAKRGNSKDANKVRVAIKDNVSALLNHAGYGSFKVYGGTFVGANPAWGDEGCMLPTTPNYLRPWSYYQGALLDGQTFNENGLVIPAGYEITKGATDNGIPTYTVTYNK